MTRSSDSDTSSPAEVGGAEAGEPLGVLGLFLQERPEDLEQDLAGAMIRVLEGLPGRGPLRRDTDRQVIDTVRSLLPELPRGNPRKDDVLRLLTERSRRASASHWPSDIWRR
jgi:hypothetical protein